MKTRFLVSKPEPLKFGEGDDQFTLYLRRFTDVDRLAIIDAFARGMAGVQAAADKLVIAWENVLDDDGNPIAIQKVNDAGQAEPRIGAFLGSLPLKKQAEVLGGILSFIGIPIQETVALFGPLFAPEADTLDPTPRPAGGTPPAASPNSSASGPLPTP